MYLTEDDIEGLENCLALITADASRKYTVYELSTEAGMSASKFKVFFRHYTGRPVFTFQKARRLNLAYTLVTESRYSLNKIAKLCGYQFLSHFNEAFSERFLISAFKLRRGLS